MALSNTQIAANLVSAGQAYSLPPNFGGAGGTAVILVETKEQHFYDSMATIQAMVNNVEIDPAGGPGGATRVVIILTRLQPGSNNIPLPVILQRS